MSTVIFNMRMSKPQNLPFVIFQTWSEVTNICRAYLHVYWEKPTSFLRTEHAWKTLKNPKAWISGILRVLPPNSVSTLRGSYGRSKGRCLIRVLTLACGILPVDFRIKWLFWCLLWHISTAQARTECGPKFSANDHHHRRHHHRHHHHHHQQQHYNTWSSYSPHTVWGLLPG